ncbi:MAG: dUTP diphosphatase [Ruminiclostridium sp.]|nr:dUTP diphosphatase [Ruminiclostridium sp.]
MNIRVKKVNENAILPNRATVSSAGADLYACLSEDVIIEPSQRILIPTGIAMAIPEGYGGFIFPRSGTASKYGISLSNCVGVVDSDYRGEVKIAVINHGNEAYTIRNGDRVAQMVIMPVDLCCYTECDSLDETKRGAGGFGSTGK